MTEISIGNKKVGNNHPVFIIAEAGSNHNQDLGQAKKLIEIAAEAEADAVKFQTYSAETLYSKKTPNPEYLEGKMEQKTVWQLIKDIELPREWQGELADFSRSQELIFLSTPFDYKAIKELEEINVPAYKIASFEIVDLPFLKKIAETKKPIILSTGMARLGEIEDAIDAIRGISEIGIALLHCAINYPPPLKDVNLKAIQTLKSAFQMPVGFSDHTMSTSIPAVAVALGASIIEKHYTIDRSLKGPDHKFALEPKELKEMVQNIRDAEAALGSPIKAVMESEKDIFKIARRSIIAAKKISKGKKIELSDLTIKRPGYGISPKFLEIILGRVAKKEIDKDDIITWDLV